MKTCIALEKKMKIRKARVIPLVISYIWLYGTQGSALSIHIGYDTVPECFKRSNGTLCLETRVERNLLKF